MPQTNINIRMDEELKRNFEHVCDELGMNMSTAMTIFAKKMTRERRIPFEVSYDPFYSESNLKALRSSREQLSDGKTVSKSIDELEAMENE
ncbi:MAG TPA: type II toxin-antitoxin system RelB/DinJ family antitoxin [Firmicutes bacterium]|nr:type II toxin-antitoxin system RelB/DinJ family antitoxin [Bacillota bacterium]